jgi:tRNA(fMet)-specific endonuclease VapC
MIYLLDTDTLIYWVKGNKTISHKVLSIGFHNINASDISKAELYYGAYKSKKLNENLLTIRNLSERIQFLTFHEHAQMTFGKVKADLERMGKRLDDIDLMIGCTALAHDLILVTNNIGHMERIPNIKIENWIEK